MKDDKYEMLSRIVFDRTIFKDSSEEINKLKINMSKLASTGLNKLNDVLVNNSKRSTRNIWDFLAEHNFATQLIENNSEGINIEYEPNRFQRPPDFVVSTDDFTINIQMKNLSETERENRKNKNIEIIKKKFIEISINKFISLRIHESFSDQDIIPFVKHVVEHLFVKERIKIQYPDSGQLLVEYSFHFPNVLELDYLTIGTVSDLNVLNVTGEHRNQINRSILKAVGAFDNNISSSNINIIAMEADNHSDIDIAEAVFGVEQFIFKTDGTRTWKRDDSGFYCRSENIDKVSAILALRRNISMPISTYTTTLFINPIHQDHVSLISNVISLDKTLNYFDLPNH